MLQSIRDRATGWIAWVIVIFISIPFALWGIQEYLNPDPTVPVAVVNGTELSLQQFQHNYQQQRQRMQNLLGRSLDLSPEQEERLRREILNRMVNEEVLVQAGIGSGLRVSDEQLANAIHVQDVFQQDGRFSRALYDQWLRQQGMSPGVFEFEFRRAILNQQLTSAIVNASLVTEHDLKGTLGLIGQKRSFSQLVVPASRFEDVEIGEDEIAAYYEENRSSLVTPEQVVLSYVELTRDSVASTIDVPEEELKSRYEAQRANFVTPEERRASHILIGVAADADEQAVNEARARAEALRARIAEGAEFEALAKEGSEDPGSASMGGDLGFFARNVMDKSFEDAVFSMDVGDVSDPVRSSFGFHIIKLTDVRPGETKPFEAVRDQLQREVQQRRAEQLYFERAERLAQLAFEHPDTLQVAAEELGLEIRQTEALSNEPGAQAGLGAEPRVLEAAFSPEVLEKRLNSEPIELDNGRIVVVRVEEHEPARQRTLEETREEIVAVLRKRAAAKRAEAEGKELLARLRSGEAMAAVAESAAASWDKREKVGRGSAEVDAQVLRAVFRMPHPAGEGARVFDGAKNGSGDFVVIALDAVEAGDFAEQVGNNPDITRRALAREFGQSAYDALVESLRDKADVKLRTENL